MLYSTDALVNYNMNVHVFVSENTERKYQFKQKTLLLHLQYSHSEDNYNLCIVDGIALSGSQ